MSGHLQTHDQNTADEYLPEFNREYFSTKPTAGPQSKVSTQRGSTKPYTSDEY